MASHLRRLAVIGIAIAVPLALFFGYLYFVVMSKPNWTEDLGRLGDSFGAVNALFTGLAFAGLLINLVQQREEIALQHRELIESRKQFERSATAQEQTARLNAYTSLLNEYSARLAALVAANKDFLAQRDRNLASSSNEMIAKALLAKTPYEGQIAELSQRREAIVGKLEGFLAGPGAASAAQ